MDVVSKRAAELSDRAAELSDKLMRQSQALYSAQATLEALKEHTTRIIDFPANAFAEQARNAAATFTVGVFVGAAATSGLLLGAAVCTYAVAGRPALPKRRRRWLAKMLLGTLSRTREDAPRSDDSDDARAPVEARLRILEREVRRLRNALKGSDDQGSDGRFSDDRSSDGDSANDSASEASPGLNAGGEGAPQPYAPRPYPPTPSS
ncbi:hypothetical protein M885DRAFT_531581 [Pelagophyceae sp. CCMP2097]|nr:hypothetical protein M885DRAFT_531581 [Pelagophyceae sp. CCMP2097]